VKSQHRDDAVPRRTVRGMEELTTPAEYVVALHTATKTGRRTPYVDRLLEALHVALIVHGPIVMLTPPSEPAVIVSAPSGTLHV
jgi:hypothetical protein